MNACCLNHADCGVLLWWPCGLTRVSCSQKLVLSLSLSWLIKCLKTFRKLHGDFPGNPVVEASPSSVGSVRSVPGWGGKTPHASKPRNQNIKQKQSCNKFNKDFFKRWSTSKKSFKKCSISVPTWSWESPEESERTCIYPHWGRLHNSSQSLFNNRLSPENQPHQKRHKSSSFYRVWAPGFCPLGTQTVRCFPALQA